MELLPSARLLGDIGIDFSNTGKRGKVNDETIKKKTNRTNREDEQERKELLCVRNKHETRKKKNK